MCGIFGIASFSKTSIAPYIVDGLSYLQHRGQDAVGVATCNENKQLFFKRKRGTIQQVFTYPDAVNTLEGHYGIGHLRYPTTGSYSIREHQPFYVNSPYGICLAHNGNLTNADALKQELFNNEKRHINSMSDSEVLLNVFAHAFQNTNNIELSIKAVHDRCEGAFSVVLLIVGIGIVAFRDKHGIRPLIVGKRETFSDEMYAVASESAALSSLGFRELQDVPPGGMCFIDLQSESFTIKQLVNDIFAPCSFEFVYLARPDSIIDGVSVYRTRRRIGKYLAEKISRNLHSLDIDVAVPIPDTSLPTTLALCDSLNIKYREALVKNRYVGRTFIMKDQQSRRNSIKRKFNILDIEVRGRNVLLVDDSIVRGNTSLQIVNMVKEAGANKVFFASASPEIAYQNVYGIDMPTCSELLVNKAITQNKTIPEMINADDVVFLDLEHLHQSIITGNPSMISTVEDSVFTGNYITNVSSDTLELIENSRLK